MTVQSPSEMARLNVPDRDLSSARMKVGRAGWAVRYYSSFPREAVLKIAEAVARAAHEKAGFYADWAVRETGFGVVEHKKIKNELSALPLLDYYRDLDLVSPRVDAARKIVELPKPAGVVFALAPATNPVATVYYKTMLAILSRNAIVISPHPAAKDVSVDAANTLARAAEAAGAPSGLIQCIENPSVPLVQDIMGSDKISVIMATGGGAMVRAAYSSSNPALGVGPGNAVAYVDPTAKVDQTARRLVASK
ncbi:MAG: aldehyde dehydrogenase family protein, partial [Rhodobacteraceae bacterium]|nr:aldehyde dehydrogenase family protein [Paracoccaceae bacterium]